MIWATEFTAVCSKTRKLKTYGGPNVEGLTADIAQQWCYENAGHLKIIRDILISEIPCKPEIYEPDFDNLIDYENNN